MVKIGMKKSMFLISLPVLAGILLALPPLRERVPESQRVRQTDVPCEEPRRQSRTEHPLPGRRPANYLNLWHFKSVIVTDSHGHSESPPYESVHVEGIPGPRVENVGYDKGGEFSVMITTPAAEAYTFTFQSPEGESGNVDLERLTKPKLAM
jgi:hypothetical protein